MKFKFIKKENILKLPKTTGVYCFKNDKEILYIGKAVNLKERIKNHLKKSNWRDRLFIEKTKKIGFIQTNSEIEALILEAQLIKKYNPKYNIVWKDDKNYFFVAITKEDFPRIFVTHQRQKTETGITYIGPFVDGKSLKQSLYVLRKIFPFRSCKSLPKRPCLWYYLERCPAPCLLKISLEKEINLKNKIKKSSQKNAKNMIKILLGKKEKLLRELKKEMKELSKKEKFEEAAKIRDQVTALEKIILHKKIFELPEEQNENSSLQYKESINYLKEFLGIKKEISRIEAFDVSNIQGKYSTGSMITFINGQPEKRLYRKFKIKTVKKPNDVAMIKEVLLRRINHKEWGFPDIILIDGGKPQLNVAVKIKKKKNELAEKIKIIALAKKENKLYVEGKKNPIFLQSLPRQIFNLILQLRDEAHRFAISYHKKLRKKELFS